MIFNAEDIARFRELIKMYELRYPEVMDKMSDFEIAAIANGIGPDSWPKALRKLATQLFGPYAVIHVPHDIRYEQHIGTRQEADKEFYSNAIKIWNARWGLPGWFQKVALIERVNLYLAYRLLVRFAKKAWED
jgi:hypothetical protein